MGWEYALMESAMAWGYRVGEWDRESIDAKARAVAHTMLKNRLEGYLREKAEAKAKREAANKGGATVPEWSRYRQGGGVEH